MRGKVDKVDLEMLLKRSAGLLRMATTSAKKGTDLPNLARDVTAGSILIVKTRSIFWNITLVVGDGNFKVVTLHCLEQRRLRPTEVVTKSRDVTR